MPKNTREIPHIGKNRDDYPGVGFESRTKGWPGVKFETRVDVINVRRIRDRDGTEEVAIEGFTSRHFKSGRSSSEHFCVTLDPKQAERLVRAITEVSVAVPTEKKSAGH